MDGLLIPFGIYPATGEMIEPEDAKNGRQCGCVCPGCKSPLLARHPKERRAHFAHDSSSPDADITIIQACPFNGPFAIRLMALHIAQSFVGEVVCLPDYSVDVPFECCKSLSVAVTKASEQMITGIESDVSANGHIFDLKFYFGQHSVLLRMKYPGRPLPDITTSELQQFGKTGVIALDLESFERSVQPELRDARFSVQVRDFVLRSGYKEWIYHPKGRRAVDQVKTDHECPLTLLTRRYKESLDETTITRKDRLDISPLQRVVSEYKCMLCNRVWNHKTDFRPQCPNGCAARFAVKLR